MWGAPGASTRLLALCLNSLLHATLDRFGVLDFKPGQTFQASGWAYRLTHWVNFAGGNACFISSLRLARSGIACYAFYLWLRGQKSPCRASSDFTVLNLPLQANGFVNRRPTRK